MAIEVKKLGSNMSIQKCRERITWCLALATLLLVVAGLSYEFLTHYTTSNTTVVMLKDATQADVLVILSEAQPKSKWAKIAFIILDAAATSNDTEQLNKDIPELLNAAGYPVIAFSVDRQKIIIDR